MKKLRYVLISTFIFLMLAGCGSDNTMDNTASPSPSSTADSMIDNAGDAVEDVGDGVVDGVKDVGEGVENGIKDITGNEENKTNNE